MAKKQVNGEAVKPSEVSKQIGEKKLKSLLKAANSAHKDQQEIRGTFGNLVKQAVENDHLHTKAFATARMMDRMTPEKLADYWDTLQYYVDASGLAERAASAPKLSFDKGEEEPDDEKVVGFPEGARH